MEQKEPEAKLVKEKPKDYAKQKLTCELERFKNNFPAYVQYEIPNPSIIIHLLATLSTCAEKVKGEPTDALAEQPKEEKAPLKSVEISQTASRLVCEFAQNSNISFEEAMDSILDIFLQQALLDVAALPMGFRNRAALFAAFLRPAPTICEKCGKESVYDQKCVNPECGK